MNEKAVRFGEASSLVGIMTEPSAAANDRHLPAIIFLNDGLIHRVGPHRLYVKMARDLAASGFAVLRFDFSGVGDSAVRRDNLPFDKSAVSETQEAMSFLKEARGSERFLLMGICSGGIRAFQTACCDPRVVGAALINIPRLSTETTEETRAFFRNRSMVHGYWKRALANWRSWLRAISGRTDYKSLIKAIGFQLSSLILHTRRRVVASMANKAQADLRLLAERDVRLLLVYAEDNVGLDYLRVMLGDSLRELKARGKVRVEIIQRGEETFAPLASQERLLKVVSTWAQAVGQG